MFLLFFPFPPARNASQREAGGEEREKRQSQDKTSVSERARIFCTSFTIWG